MGRGPKEKMEGAGCLVSLNYLEHGGFPRNFFPDREK